MKLFNVNQIRKWDEFTIKNEPISSVDLMERAALACFNWLKNADLLDNSFHLVCGMGNNGGDGLAIARMLFQEGCSVAISIINFKDKGSLDFEQNKHRLLDLGVPFEVVESNQVKIEPNEIVIDSIFGSGLTKPIVGDLAELIDAINQQSKLIVSIDIPTGLFADENRTNNGGIVQANATLTFQVPKLSFLLPKNYGFVGEWQGLDIGLSKEFYKNETSQFNYITPNWVEQNLMPRGKFSHKGNFGHALIMAGEEGKIGAAVLSTKAALRSGSGLVTTFVPKCGYDILQQSVPEAMCMQSQHQQVLQGIPDITKYNSIAFGPGVGMSLQASQSLKMLIQEARIPLVIDADGLNILAENKTWLSYLPYGSVLTPHVGEAKRLFGDFTSEEQRLEVIQEKAKKHKLVIVLKGAHTAVVLPSGQVWFNSTGNAGMATGGSGDVLTGIITSLIGQGYSSETAAILGVYFHGLAGDLAAKKVGQVALIAGDIVNGLTKAFNAV